jgi:predicted metal-binding membrane protein
MRVTVALRWRPEWPVAVLVIAGWLYVIALQAMGSHQLHAAPAIVAWSVMTILMMVPVTLPAIRHLAFNSFRSRRPRAIAIYMASYVCAWIVFGAMALALIDWLDPAIGRRALTIITLASAAVWQLSLYRRRTLAGCRRAPSLPPIGLRADAACAGFGIAQARHCLIVCWPVMLLMAIVGHQLLLMLAVTAVLIAEEQTRWRERLLGPVAGAFAAAAMFTLFVG